MPIRESKLVVPLETFRFRLYPLTWIGRPAAKIELIGCGVGEYLLLLCSAKHLIPALNVWAVRSKDRMPHCRPVLFLNQSVYCCHDCLYLSYQEMTELLLKGTSSNKDHLVPYIPNRIKVFCYYRKQ